MDTSGGQVPADNRIIVKLPNGEIRFFGRHPIIEKIYEMVSDRDEARRQSIKQLVVAHRIDSKPSTHIYLRTDKHSGNIWYMSADGDLRCADIVEDGRDLMIGSSKPDSTYELVGDGIIIERSPTTKVVVSALTADCPIIAGCTANGDVSFMSHSSNQTEFGWSYAMNGAPFFRGPMLQRIFYGRNITGPGTIAYVMPHAGGYGTDCWCFEFDKGKHAETLKECINRFYPQLCVKTSGAFLWRNKGDKVEFRLGLIIHRILADTLDIRPVYDRTALCTLCNQRSFYSDRGGRISHPGTDERYKRNICTLIVDPIS